MARKTFRHIKNGDIVTAEFYFLDEKGNVQTDHQVRVVVISVGDSTLTILVPLVIWWDDSKKEFNVESAREEVTISRRSGKEWGVGRAGWRLDPALLQR